jgi:hypothetical protein
MTVSILLQALQARRRALQALPNVPAAELARVNYRIVRALLTLR